jgi:hypothetical protein
MAAVGKLAVFAIYAQAWSSGEVALGQLGVPVGDLVFALLFIAALLIGPRSAMGGHSGRTFESASHAQHDD